MLTAEWDKPRELILSLFSPADEPSPRLSAQAQVAEDILDKYRNAIKRTSPSEGALANDESTGENHHRFGQ